MTSSQPGDAKGLRVLMTGGAGFLGAAILRELAKAPPAELRVLDLREPPAGAPLPLRWPKAPLDTLARTRNGRGLRADVQVRVGALSE